MKLVRLSTYIVILGSLVACSFGTETKIHNQLETELIVEINDNTYELAPNQLVEISYKYGENRIKSTSENEVIVDTIVNITRAMTNDGALINVTGKPYFIMTERYGSSVLDTSMFDHMIPADSTQQENNLLAAVNEPNLKLEMARMKIVVIDSISIIGDIETLPANQIVIPRDWYYHLNSEFEESIETSDVNETYFGKSVKKIFSEKELLAYWNDEQ